MDAETNLFQSQLMTEHKASKNDHTPDQSVAYPLRDKALASVVNLIRQFLDLRGRPAQDLTEETISRVLAAILNEYEDLEIIIEELQNNPVASQNNIDIAEPGSKDSHWDSHNANRDTQGKPRLWQNLHISVAENEGSEAAQNDRPEDPFNSHNKDRLLDQMPLP
jgi:hypothetical protein